MKVNPRISTLLDERAVVVRQMHELAEADELMDVEEWDKLEKRERGYRKQVEALETLDNLTEEVTEVPSQDAESRALDRLRSKTQFGAFLRAAASEKPLSGAEAELIQHEHRDGDAWSGLGGVPVPLDLLAGPETRANENTSFGGDGESTVFVPKLFAGSVSDFLGVPMPMINRGKRSWALVGDVAATSALAKGAAVESTPDQTWTVEQLSPIRLTSSARVSVEDLAVSGGVETSVRQMLAAEVKAKHENFILNGASPLGKGLIGARGTADTSLGSSGTPATAAQWRGLRGSAVDGIRATRKADVKVVLGPDCWEQADGLLAATNAPDTAADAYLPVNSTRISDHVPAASSNVSSVILARPHMSRPWMVAPVWSSAQIVRDPYSHAQSGLVALTCILLANQKVLDATGYLRAAVAIA